MSVADNMVSTASDVREHCPLLMIHHSVNNENIAVIRDVITVTAELPSSGSSTSRYTLKKQRRAIGHVYYKSALGHYLYLLKLMSCDGM